MAKSFSTGRVTCDNCGRPMSGGIFGKGSQLNKLGFGIFGYLQGKQFCSEGCKRAFNSGSGGGGESGESELIEAVGGIIGLAASGVGLIATGLVTGGKMIANEIKEAQEQKAIQDAENARIAKEQGKLQFEALKKKSQKTITQSQTATVQPKAIENIFCGDCGIKNESSDMFCSDCGSKLN